MQNDLEPLNDGARNSSGVSKTSFARSRPRPENNNTITNRTGLEIDRDQTWPLGRSQDRNSGVETELKRLISKPRPRIRSRYHSGLETPTPRRRNIVSV